MGMLDLLTYHDSLSEDPLSVPLMFDPRCEAIRVAPIVQCLSLSSSYPAYLCETSTWVAGYQGAANGVRLLSSHAQRQTMETRNWNL